MKTSPLTPVRVLCAANAAYAAPLCVMLTSLAINHTKGREIEIYVLATNIPDEDRRKIEASLCQNRPDFNLKLLHWLSPSLEVLADLHVDGWAQVEVYARLLAPRILPDDFDRILYLDSDTVVLSDLSPLYDSVCEGKSVLAVRDDTIGWASAPFGVFNYQELGIHPHAPYFNSGVLLINLPYWKSQDVTDRVLAYLKLYGASVHFWDQGGLNAILHDSWAEVDPVWNQARSILRWEFWTEYNRPLAEWRRALYHPKIVHYTGRDKPWIANPRPGYSYFFDYLSKTPYRDTIKGPRFECFIGFRLNYILWSTKNYIFFLIRLAKRFISPVLKPLLRHIAVFFKKPQL